jgi:2-polyprenyl-3-methyl-5-hydroxy-6-metoxy-1,4-benzoquinol methylase
MHYIINNSKVVKSENAALTTKQTNKIILEYISTLPNSISSLDYGCGKLRHSIPLYSKTQDLTVIDSVIQLSRQQCINNLKTSVYEYIKKYMPYTKAFSIENFKWPKEAYDFILCSNVLSAIPDVLERKKVLDNIRVMLKPNGKALISIQFSNSYFKTYLTNPIATAYLDGWLIGKKDGSYSFYGIINKDQLIVMCEASNLKVNNVRQCDGSVYIVVE